MEGFTYLYENSSDWQTFINSARKRASIRENVRELPHPAAPLLDELRSPGARGEFTTAPWTFQEKDDAVAMNGYRSTHGYLGFLENEMVDMIKKGYWVVLPYRLVRNMENLRLSQAGIIPQRDRRPRLIVDYKRSGVNDATLATAPQEAMQFGRAPDRLLHGILTADPSRGPVYLLKNDIADGFYQIFVEHSAVPSMGMVMPVGEGEEPLIAFPLVLPMGWSQSPPYFCSVTETIVDLANSYVGDYWNPPPHPLEELADTLPPDLPADRQVLLSTSSKPAAPPFDKEIPWNTNKRRKFNQSSARFDVFVDDEIAWAQGSPEQLARYRRQLFHLNNRVLRPNDDLDDHRKEPISTSKLRKGDAVWTTYKQMLGWILDTLRGTIELPPHRKARLLKILDHARSRKRLSTKACQRLLGELRSMMLAVSGGAGLLSQLQHALTSAKGARVRLRQEARDHLNDLYALALDVANRPTRIAELFPKHPGDFFGACDACGDGMGGFYFNESEEPVCWRASFPTDVQEALVSYDNPHGTINNSELELAATVLHEKMLTSRENCVEKTVRTFSDNIAAVSWRNKGSTTTEGPAAYLLRDISLLQREKRHVPRVHYLPGGANTIADILSRRWDLSDDQLTQYLNSKFPQTKSWKMLRLNSEHHSTTISALRRKRRDPLSQPIEPKPLTKYGPRLGSHFYKTSESTTLSSPASMTKSLFYASSPYASDLANVPSVSNLSQLKQSVTTSFTSRRSSPSWVRRTRA